MNLKKIFEKKTAVILILSAVIALHFTFGLQRIYDFTGGDETLWSYDRVPNFWNAIKTQNWKKTNISDKPGITLAFISGLGLPFVSDPRPYGDLMYAAKTAEQLAAIDEIYFYLRLPVLIFSLLAILSFYYLAEKLLGKKIALVSTVFIGLSPILVGMSIYINSDALSWVFVPLTILAFLLYQKSNSRKYLLLSGILLGLSLLTKYVAVILFPFLLLLVFLRYVFNDYSKNALVYFKKAGLDYSFLLLVSTLVIVMLFPATWVKPTMILDFSIFSRPFLKIWPLFLVIGAIFLFDFFVLKKYLTRRISDLALKYRTLSVRLICAFALVLIIFTFANTYTDMKMLNVFSLLSDPRNGANQTAFVNLNGKITENILASFFSLIFGLTPVVALIFIATVILVMKAPKGSLLNDKKDQFAVAFHLILFVLIYYFASSLLGVSSMVRYQIALYPLASIVAAIGLVHLMNLEKVKKYFAHGRFYILMLVLIAASVCSLYLIKPFYLEYNSILLPQKYLLNPDNSGDGSSDISRYLNSLPNAENLYVWTDVRQVCEKFAGKCAFGLKGWSKKDDNFDYFVMPVADQGSNAPYENNLNQLKIGSSLLDTSELYAADRNYDFKIAIDSREISTIKVIENNKK